MRTTSWKLVQLQKENHGGVLCAFELRGGKTWEVYALIHFGIHRSQGKLQLAWYQPRMISIVKKVVSSCEMCQAAKSRENKAARGNRGCMLDNPGNRWQSMWQNIYRRPPRVLVVENHFAHWQYAIALFDAVAPIVANFVDEKVFCYFVFLEQIYTDHRA